MIVIAKTDDGVLIKATVVELRGIVRAVTGAELKEIVIGQKVPAIDYAATITKIKALETDYDFQQIFKSLESFNKTADAFSKAIKNASNIDG